MHCVSAYPVPTDQAHLRWIQDLAERFAAPIGFSDHTVDAFSGAFAVCAGACAVERHLTYDKSAPGPDHAASSDPTEFAEYVRLVRLAAQMCGNAPKGVLPIEQDVRTASRQSLVVGRDVRQGQIITHSDLIAQRPGTGICASQTGRAVGRRAARDLREGTLLQWDMLADAA
jgi:sialic acid synthase SpsE